MERFRRLKPACFVLFLALLCGTGVFVVGAVNLFYPAFGYEFLQLLVKLFPGYTGTSTLVSVLTAAGYSFLLGLVIGLLLLSGRKYLQNSR